MKRLALCAAALITLTSLSACGDKEQPEFPYTPVQGPAEVRGPGGGPAEPVVDEDRFITTYADLATLMADLQAQPDLPDPKSTEEANKLAGLDETTPLYFADYTVDPADESTGAFCLEAAETETYVSVAYSGAEAVVNLGDGECSYENSEAEVVGDVGTDTWTTGGELMGDLAPASIFGQPGR